MPKTPVKTSPGVVGPPKRVPTPILQAKSARPSAVAQRKTVASAKSVKQPVAPPPYRPVVKSVTQPKTAGPLSLKAPVAPAVYRPQPTPKALQRKVAPHAVIQRKEAFAPKPNQQIQRAPYRPITNHSGVIQRSKGWGKLPQIKPQASAEYPLLGAKLSPQEEEESRQKALAEMAAKKEEDRKKAEARLQKMVEIENRDRRETWWGLLGLDEGSAGNRVLRLGAKFEGSSVHITVVKARTNNPSFTKDSVAEIVDKIIGPADVQDSCHATLELNGAADPGNPRYYRNGDQPNCTAEQALVLRGVLIDFITDTRDTVTAEKQRLLA